MDTNKPQYIGAALYFAWMAVVSTAVAIGGDVSPFLLRLFCVFWAAPLLLMHDYYCGSRNGRLIVIWAVLFVVGRYVSYEAVRIIFVNGTGSLDIRTLCYIDGPVFGLSYSVATGLGLSLISDNVDENQK